MVQYSQEYIKDVIKALDSRAFLENEYEIEFIESGNNWLNCSCPFPDHNDRSPSFGYNIESDHFNCFGCGETGNLINLVQKIESISFPAAIQKLSIAAGIGHKGLREYGSQVGAKGADVLANKMAPMAKKAIEQIPAAGFRANQLNDLMTQWEKVKGKPVTQDQAAEMYLRQGNGR